MAKREMCCQKVNRQRAIPSWEKAFCSEAGLFEKFLKTKQPTGYNYKVLHWNDSAAEEAFHAASNRFFDRIHGMRCTEGGPLMDPDLFIDEIKWDDGDDPYTPEKMIMAKLEKEDEEEDYRYYIRMIDEVRSGQGSEV